MILRRIANGIKNQDWFVVFIEIIIVVLGVYIGLYLGDIQEERKLAKDTNQSLIALELELRSDLTRVDEIIAHQRLMISTFKAVVRNLNSPEIDNDQLKQGFLFIDSGSDTFFQNQSAYQTMQTSGYLPALPDEALRLQITKLFEREFERQEFVANLYDEVNQKIKIHIFTRSWDTENGRLVNTDPIEIIRLRNGVSRMSVIGNYYLKFIENTVRPEMIETLEMIDAYQGEGEE